MQKIKNSLFRLCNFNFHGIVCVCVCFCELTTAAVCTVVEKKAKYMRNSLKGDFSYIMQCDNNDDHPTAAEN